MPDQVTRVEHVGVFSALAQSFKNVIGGAGLFILAFPVMFWNECNSVQTARSLDEGLGAVVSVSADSVDAANEGALVRGAVYRMAKCRTAAYCPRLGFWRLVLSASSAGVHRRRSSVTWAVSPFR